MQNIQELPLSTREKLKNLVEKDVSFITESDLEFLRARESYLTEEEKARVFVEIKDAEIEEIKPTKKTRKVKKG